MPKIPILETNRLILRPFTPDDASRVHQLLASPDIARTTLNIAWPYPTGAAEGWIASHQQTAADGDGFVWAICLKPANALVGTISLHVDQRHRRGELGYWLGVDFWNQGIMSEAAQRVVRHGFGPLDLHRIQAKCLPANRGSSRVMEHAGMTYEGTLRGYVQKDGHFQDIAIYAVLRGDAQQA